MVIKNNTIVITVDDKKINYNLDYLLDKYSNFLYKMKNKLKLTVYCEYSAIKNNHEHIQHKISILNKLNKNIEIFNNETVKYKRLVKYDELNGVGNLIKVNKKFTTIINESWINNNDLQKLYPTAKIIKFINKFEHKNILIDNFIIDTKYDIIDNTHYYNM